MTTLRRIIAAVFIILLLPVFLTGIAVAQVNETVLSADFYVAQMREADVFDFAYDQILPAALDAVSEDAPGVLREEKGKIILIAKNALPPDWLQRQSEAAVRQFVPYMTGQTDSFLVTVPLREPIEKVGQGVKDISSDPAVYAFIVDEAIAPQVERVLEERDVLPLGIRLESEDLVEAFKTVAPQEWVAAAVRQTADQVVPFATGAADSFAIVIPVQDRVEATGPALKGLLAGSGAYAVVDGPEFAASVQKQIDGLGRQPLGLSLTGEQVTGVLRQVVTPEWVQAHGEDAIDQIVPYLAGRTEGFEVVVPLKDRIDAAGPAFKSLLQDTGAYRFVGDDLVAGVVAKHVRGNITLPIGVEVTPEDVTGVLRRSLPDDYLRQQTDALVDGLVDYMTGDAETLRVAMPLDTPRDRALVEVEALVVSKLRVEWDALPPCGFTETVDLLRQASFSTVPSCRPEGFTLAQMKQALNITDPGVTEQEIAAQLGVDAALLTQGVTFDWLLDRFGGTLWTQVQARVGAAIPASYVYTDANLRAGLPPEGMEKIDTVLKWGREGYVFTEADLRKALGAEGAAGLDNLRKWARDGFRYTDADLQKAFRTSTLEGKALYERVLGYTRNGLTFSDADLRDLTDGEAGAEEGPAGLEGARRAVSAFRSFQWVAYVVPLLLILAVAFLGGRGLRGRLAWGSAALGIAALAAVVVYGIVYNAVVWPRFEASLAQAASQSGGVERLMMQKALDVARSVSAAIVGGMAWKAGACLVLAGAGFAVAAFLPRIKNAIAERRQGPSAPAPEA
jgi:hypothetical protein